MLTTLKRRLILREEFLQGTLFLHQVKSHQVWELKVEEVFRTKHTHWMSKERLLVLRLTTMKTLKTMCLILMRWAAICVKFSWSYHVLYLTAQHLLFLRTLSAQFLFSAHSNGAFCNTAMSRAIVLYCIRSLAALWTCQYLRVRLT